MEKNLHLIESVKRRDRPENSKIKNLKKRISASFAKITLSKEDSIPESDLEFENEASEFSDMVPPIQQNMCQSLNVTPKHFSHQHQQHLTHLKNQNLSKQHDQSHYHPCHSVYQHQYLSSPNHHTLQQTSFNVDNNDKNNSVNQNIIKNSKSNKSKPNFLKDLFFRHSIDVSDQDNSTQMYNSLDHGRSNASICNFSSNSLKRDDGEGALKKKKTSIRRALSLLSSSSSFNCKYPPSNNDHNHHHSKINNVNNNNNNNNNNVKNVDPNTRKVKRHNSTGNMLAFLFHKSVRSQHNNNINSNNHLNNNNHSYTFDKHHSQDIMSSSYHGTPQRDVHVSFEGDDGEVVRRRKRGSRSMRPRSEGSFSEHMRGKRASSFGSNSPFGKLHNYEKLEKLGEGSYATVYKGISRLTKQVVAMKEIRLQSEEGAPFTAIREASLLKGLKHCNIVTLHDIVHTKTSLTFVFELLHTDLGVYLERNSKGINPKNVKLFMFQLLRGLLYCHNRKILHRDLKPQNLLLTEIGELKLADFGLARAKSVPSRTFSSEVVTLWYRPPEVLLGSSEYSTSLDMWGVGCIFVEMLTGNALFPGLKDNNDQLEHIWKVLGTLTEDEWEGVTSLPNYNTENFKTYGRRKLIRSVPKLSSIPYGEQLAEQLLQRNPKMRLDCYSAFHHQYFFDVPNKLYNLPDDTSIFSVFSIKLSPELDDLIDKHAHFRSHTCVSSAKCVNDRFKSPPNHLSKMSVVNQARVNQITHFAFPSNNIQTSIKTSNTSQDNSHYNGYNNLHHSIMDDSCNQIKHFNQMALNRLERSLSDEEKCIMRPRQPSFRGPSAV